MYGDINIVRVPFTGVRAGLTRYSMMKKLHFHSEGELVLFANEGFMAFTRLFNTESDTMGSNIA